MCDLSRLLPTDPSLQLYHDPDDEPVADPIDPSFFDFDDGEPLEKEDLKGMRHHISTSLLVEIGDSTYL